MDKYLINLGFINITWYAFFIVIAMIIGAFVIIKSKSINKVMTKDQIYDYLFYLVIFSILGARLWYVIFSTNYYLVHPLQIIAIWNGGLAIHGGLIGGLVYTIYYAKKHKFSFFILTDTIITPLLLGQSIGRWGNFINKEAHGPKTTLEFLQNTLHLPTFIVNGMYIDGNYYQPTFLYESIWNFLGFLLIIILLKNIWQNKLGYLSCFYLIWYGFIRIFIEQLRTDALMFFNIKIAQFTSFLMIICGIALFIYLIRQNRLKNKL